MSNEDMQTLGKNAVDLALASFGAWTKGVQAVAAEMVDYSTTSAACSAAAWDRMMAAKDPQKAMELQSEYFKSACEDFVARTARLGEIYAGFAKQAYKPFEATRAKSSSAK